MTWQHATIGDVVRITRSGIAPDEISAGTTYVGLEHIDGSGTFVGVATVDAGELGSSKFRFNAQHILFGKLRPYLRKTARPSFDGVCSTDILPLEPTASIDRDYLFHVLRRQSFVDEVTSLCAGANLPRISPKVLADMKIPVPPLPEQRRIAAILDNAEALRTKRREAIAKLDQLLQSVFLDTFGDPVTNPKGWSRTTLGQIAREKMANGIFRKKGAYSEAGIPVVWVEELFRGQVLDLARSRTLTPNKREVDTYGLLPGDILFCRSSLKLDGIAYNNVYLGEPNRALFECHLIRLRVREETVDPVFLNYMLRLDGIRKRIKQRAKTSTMTTIDQDGLSEVEIVLPSLNLQREFRAFLERSLKHLKLLEADELALMQFIQSLQQRAFSGAL